jgi:TnpA family transposase
MPSGFLSLASRQTLNNFPETVEESDLIAYFLLTADELAQVTYGQGASQRLGFALLLCGLRYLGFFPTDLHQAPSNVVVYLAQQIDCDPAALNDYGTRPQTRREHQQHIMAYLGFRPLSDADETRLLTWLSERALENDRPSILLQQASERLYRQRLVRPAITRLERLVVRARGRAQHITYERLVPNLDDALRARLDGLLQPHPDYQGLTALSWLRRPARSNGAQYILQTLSKLTLLQSWQVDAWHLQALPPARLRHLVGIARRSSNQALQRKAPEQRYPILMAFLADARQVLTDEALDLFDSRLTETERNAKRDLTAHQITLNEALQHSVRTLGKVADVVLDDSVSDEHVRDQIFAQVSREHLATLLATLEQQQRKLDKLHFIDRRYSYLRRFLPTFLATLTFHAYQSPDTLLEAMQVLHEVDEDDGSLPSQLSQVPLDFIPSEWVARVVNRDATVNRRAYELCVMWTLQAALRSGRIWVEHSRRYTHLDSYLMPKALWQQQKAVFFELVPIQHDSKAHLAHLQAQLKAAYRDLDAQLPNDEALRIEDEQLVLTPFEGQWQPTALSDQVQALMPRVQLAEVLHEVDTWTHFSRHFEHAAGSPARIDASQRHLYAVMLAQARNIDFKQMVDVVDLSYGQLLWYNTWYVRADTLTPATAELVYYQYRQALSHYWGDGRFSSSDGQRFAVAVRTQNATPLPRYFGFGRGLTFLTWTSNQYSQYGTLVTPPTHGEAAYTLDKILDHETTLDIREHTTDTAGYTDLLFALFDLVGIQFAPRLADIGDTRLYYIDRDQDYQHIQALKRHQLKLNLIHDNWDDMLRLAASLKLRWTIPSLIIRKLQAFRRQHVLTKALQEYGRLVKTRFILRYFRDEAYRRRIATQLNKGEKLHALRAYIHSANRGMIRKKYPEQHLNQANCLNLIVNAIIVWNTVYMQAAVAHLRETGQEITDEDLSQLSPVRFEHINVHGKYSFDISVPLDENGLRPLSLNDRL